MEFKTVVNKIKNIVEEFSPIYEGKKREVAYGNFSYFLFDLTNFKDALCSLRGYYEEKIKDVARLKEVGVEFEDVFYPVFRNEVRRQILSDFRNAIKRQVYKLCDEHILHIRNLLEHQHPNDWLVNELLSLREIIGDQENLLINQTKLNLNLMEKKLEQEGKILNFDLKQMQDFDVNAFVRSVAKQTEE